jgi:hypothetical protein
MRDFLTTRRHQLVQAHQRIEAGTGRTQVGGFDREIAQSRLQGIAQIRVFHGSETTRRYPQGLRDTRSEMSSEGTAEVRR